MNFFEYEITKLAEKFAHVKSTIEDDFEQFELDAINQLGVLKNENHLYLGNCQIFKNKPLF